MLHKFLFIFLIYGIIFHTVVVGEKDGEKVKFLDGSPVISEHNGKPYLRGILTGYDENDQLIVTYIDDKMCEELKKHGVECSSHEDDVDDDDEETEFHVPEFDARSHAEF